MSVAVVEELVTGGFSGFGGTTLLGGEVAQGDEKGAVNGTSLV